MGEEVKKRTDILYILKHIEESSRLFMSMNSDGFDHHYIQHITRRGNSLDVIMRDDSRYVITVDTRHVNDLGLVDRTCYPQEPNSSV